MSIKVPPPRLRSEQSLDCTAVIQNIENDFELQTDNPRRQRSLQRCHYYAHLEDLQPTRPVHTYIPELSERIERDPNLCDGARRCARLLAAYVYRRDRETRSSEVTVTYLARAMRRCRRTVQRYLRQLERGGYIRAYVVASERSRLCVGLIVTLLSPLFARHHTQKWPDQLRKSGATRLSQKHSSRYKKAVVPLQQWALRCMDGVYRSLILTLPSLPAFH